MSENENKPTEKMVNAKDPATGEFRMMPQSEATAKPAGPKLRRRYFEDDPSSPETYDAIVTIEGGLVLNVDLLSDAAYEELIGEEKALNQQIQDGTAALNDEESATLVRTTKAPFYQKFLRQYLKGIGGTAISDDRKAKLHYADQVAIMGAVAIKSRYGQDAGNFSPGS